MKFKSFSTHLAKWRKRRGLTQSQAAMFLEESVDTYRKWEQGVSEPTEATESAVRSKAK